MSFQYMSGVIEYCKLCFAQSWLNTIFPRSHKVWGGGLILRVKGLNKGSLSSISKPAHVLHLPDM